MTPFDEQKEGREPLIAALGEDSRLDDAHLRRVLDAIPAPVSYVDTALRFRYNNRAYDAWVGRPHEELYGTHVREVLGEKAYREVLPYMREALAGREAEQGVLVLLDRVEAELAPPFAERMRSCRRCFVFFGESLCRAMPWS